MITPSEVLGKEQRFRRSALTLDNPLQSTAEAREWLAACGAANELVVQRIPFAEMSEWSFELPTGDLVHRTGRFFRVHGVHVVTDDGTVREWEQPIIDQPEIGILGMIAKDFDGQLLFLMQAKLEPGNPMGVQLTPTVQATHSNYTQVHQGARPKYLDYFLNRDASTVLVDQLQFEQGSTFLRKRNRNIIVESPGDVLVEDGFRWFTLGQLKQLLRVPNLVSMDARTVISCIPLHRRGSEGSDALIEAGLAADAFGARLLESLAESGLALHDDDAVRSWLTDLKCRYRADVRRIGLGELTGWRRLEDRVCHDGGRFFEVVGVRVKAKNREVAHWDQPLVHPAEQGLIAFLAAEINGVLHVLVQGKIEPGNPDVVAVGPSVQCVQSMDSLSDVSSWPPFTDLALRASADAIRYSCIQAEEGGRFYHAENEYRLVEIDVNDVGERPDGYTWVTMRQLNELLHYGLVNVEARSLLACLSFV